MFIDNVYCDCNTKKSNYLAFNTANFCRFFSSAKEMRKYIEQSDISCWECLKYDRFRDCWISVDFVKNRLYIVDIESVEVTEALEE